MLSGLVAAAVLIVATCLLIGFMTPIAAVVIGLASAAVVIFTFDTDAMTINEIVQTAVIALLGPGAFSIDARMFGRREILIHHAPRWPKP